ncbi:MAG: cytochrome b [Rhodospirillaceae bacterium]
MSTPVTPIRTYGTVAVALHWIVAVCLLCSIVLGLFIGNVEESAATEQVLAVHKSFGITIFVLMLARLAWRLTHPAPPLPATMSAYQRVAAALTHGLLYVTLLAMPIAGYIAVSARGRETSYFGLFDVPQWAPLSRVLSQNATTVHVYGQYLVYALLAAHIGAALYHRLILKDDVLARMLPRRAPETNGPQAGDLTRA